MRADQSHVMSHILGWHSENHQPHPVERCLQRSSAAETFGEREAWKLVGVLPPPVQPLSLFSSTRPEADAQPLAAEQYRQGRAPACGTYDSYFFLLALHQVCLLSPFCPSLPSVPDASLLMLSRCWNIIRVTATTI